MKKKILLLTVGGSHKPILTSIRSLEPDIVHFICSKDSNGTKGSYTSVIGKGKVNKSAYEQPKDLPNIVELAGLSEDSYVVHKVSADDLNDCYIHSIELIDELHKTEMTADIHIDYTGGTKSMTAGLAMAAFDDGRCQLSVITGFRKDLVRVQDQTEYQRPVRILHSQVIRKIKTAEFFIESYNYDAAENIILDLIKHFSTLETEDELRKMLSLCRAFNAWDHFDHQLAQRHLTPYKRDFLNHAIFLSRLLKKTHHANSNDANKEDDVRIDKFELVEDLLLNAERRAVQNRYDDAIGRLYRALELMAQIYLSNQYGINTSNIDLDKLPESQKEDYQKRRELLPKQINLKTGLRESWELIASFEKDKLGQFYNEKRGRLINFLEVRNNSLFAHGLTPIRQDEYEKHAEHIFTFLRDALKLVFAKKKSNKVELLPQFPTKFDVSF